MKNCDRSIIVFLKDGRVTLFCIISYRNIVGAECLLRQIVYEQTRSHLRG